MAGTKEGAAKARELRAAKFEGKPDPLAEWRQRQRVKKTCEAAGHPLTVDRGPVEECECGAVGGPLANVSARSPETSQAPPPAPTVVATTVDPHSVAPVAVRESAAAESRPAPDGSNANPGTGKTPFCPHAGQVMTWGTMPADQTAKDCVLCKAEAADAAERAKILAGGIPGSGAAKPGESNLTKGGPLLTIQGGKVVASPTRPLGSLF